MALLASFGFAGSAILILVTFLWMLSLILRNASIADICWGLGFVICCWIYFALCPDGYLPRKMLLGALVTAWGLRLSLHILLRNWGSGEDFRYRAWREQAGPGWWWRSYFKVFVLQGCLMWVLSAPLLAAQLRSEPSSLTGLDFIAIPVWALGFFFEAAGDWQLTRFKKEAGNQGRVLQTGVWRYTRHPNYFGDAAQWWAYYLIAAASGGAWSVFSPVLMTYLLLRVSGVTLLEETLAKTKPGYKEYVANTSPFVPWFPRQNN